MLCASLFAGMLATPVWLTGTAAHAAQPYTCICNGEKKRFLASTKYCERQNNVKSCSQRQYNATYTKACKANGCRLPAGRDKL
jgi:hypothetical protein